MNDDFVANYLKRMKHARKCFIAGSIFCLLGTAFVVLAFLKGNLFIALPCIPLFFLSMDYLGEPAVMDALGECLEVFD